MNNKKTNLNASFLLNHVQSFITRLNLNSHQTILIGLSGGPDSVALLHLLSTLKSIFGYKLIAAHLDHEWREHSNLDLVFCQELCQKLNVNLICKRASNLTFKPKATGSKEDHARQLRHFFLKQVAQEQAAQYIALGHHLDDNIETFLIRLIRGSSLNGLGVMQAACGLYLRPLLAIPKQAILDYLAENDLTFMQDSTNDSELFLRNRVRKLLPELSLIDARFKQNFNKTVNKIQLANSFIQNIAQQTLTQISHDKKMDLKLFKTLDPFLQSQVILAWLYQNQVKFTQTDNFINEILKFFNSPHGVSHQIGINWQIIKKQNLVEINVNSI